MKRWIKAARNSSNYTPRPKPKRNSANKTGYDYDRRNFDSYQQEEIQKGLESGVDVSIYADPKFDGEQMEEIRKGLESGVDVSVYLNPKSKNKKPKGEWGSMVDKLLRDADAGIDSLYEQTEAGGTISKEFVKVLKNKWEFSSNLQFKQEGEVYGYMTKKLMKFLPKALIMQTSTCL